MNLELLNLDDLDDKSLCDLYESMKESSKIIDVASMDTSGIKELKKFLYKYAKTGDMLRVNVNLEHSKDSRDFVADAVFLENGAEVETLDNNLFLPFEGIGIGDISSSSSNSISISSTTFEFIDDKVVVNGQQVDFGTEFVVGGRRVVLAKGSVVLLLEDSLVKVFPEDGVQGEIVVNDGTLAVGDIMTTGIFQMEKKNETEDLSTQVLSYIFFHNGTTDQRTCVSKRTHTVNYLQTSASSLVDLGYSDGTLQNVLDYSTSSINIRSVSENNNSVATIDVHGLSFSSNDSAVTLGNFRIKYDDETDTIQIQHFDDQTGLYVTKREFGR